MPCDPQFLPWCPRGRLRLRLAIEGHRQPGPADSGRGEGASSSSGAGYRQALLEVAAAEKRKGSSPCRRIPAYTLLVFNSVIQGCIRRAAAFTRTGKSWRRTLAPCWCEALNSETKRYRDKTIRRRGLSSAADVGLYADFILSEAGAIIQQLDGVGKAFTPRWGLSSPPPGWCGPPGGRPRPGNGPPACKAGFSAQAALVIWGPPLLQQRVVFRQVTSSRKRFPPWQRFDCWTVPSAYWRRSGECRWPPAMIFAISSGVE